MNIQNNRAVVEQLRSSEQRFQAAKEKIQALEQQLEAAEQQLKEALRHTPGQRANIERKQAEAALQESEGKFRTLFDGSLHPITIYDRDAKIVLVNKIGAENLKKTQAEITGKPLSEFIPEKHEVTVKRVREVLETGEALHVEDEISLSEGKRWFLSTLHPILNPQGPPSLVQVVSYDITDVDHHRHCRLRSDSLCSQGQVDSKLSDIRRYHAELDAAEHIGSGINSRHRDVVVYVAGIPHLWRTHEAHRADIQECQHSSFCH